MRLVWGTVASVVSREPDVERPEVELDSGDLRPAMSYPALGGRCAVGDRVLVNTTAVDLGLGTGGVDLVVVRLQDGRSDGVAFDEPSGGHIMKLRYSPLQKDVLSVEEEASGHHAAMTAAIELGGMPVVCCGLHSQISTVAAAIKEARPHARLAYVMSDEATLALPMSDTIRACRAAGLIDATVTCGQAFGGDLEAVNLYSGMLASRCAAVADLALVAIGPGVAGTGTPFGHGGVAQGMAINAAVSLGGRPVSVLRLSFSDARERHRGVSHHSLIALGRVALARSRVPVPDLDPREAAIVESQLADAGVWDVHERVDARRRPSDLPDLRGVVASTMGRTPTEDPTFFAAAAAAGDVAVSLL